MIGPYVVAAVWVCGIIQSAYLLTKRPWSKRCVERLQIYAFEE